MKIERLNDILPHVDGHPEFVVARRDFGTVIDYNYAMPDSFDDPVRLECRGIKFDRSGAILARPLHKFFNVGERIDTQPNMLDFGRSHIITEKLDGSMIHPAVVDGELVLMTRMGRTDVALKAEKLLTDDMAEAMEGILHYGITPIFEFTAPDNRIIIRYEDRRLSLLAARHTVSGEYLDVADLEDMAKGMGAPLVKHYPSDWHTSTEFIDYVRAIEGVEGFVVRFSNGLWVKAKGDDYVLKHKAKDSILQEKNVLAMILGGQLDDVLPLLETGDRESIESYRNKVLSGVAITATQVRNLVDAGAALDQKTFAVEHLKSVAPYMRPLAFQVRQGKDPRQAIEQMLMKHTSSQTDMDAGRILHGATWNL